MIPVNNDYCSYIETNLYNSTTYKNANEIINKIDKYTQIKKFEYIKFFDDIDNIKFYDLPSTKNQKELIINTLDLPDIDTSFKGFMDYRTITDETTLQWKIQQVAYTDEYGVRKYNDDCCVALGSYYVENIGDRFEVTLDNGNVFTIIAAELKKDEHTDENNQYVPMTYDMGNVIEFIVDDNIIHDGVWTLGDVSYYEKFSGNILEIKLLERNKEMS